MLLLAYAAATYSGFKRFPEIAYVAFVLGAGYEIFSDPRAHGTIYFIALLGAAYWTGWAIRWAIAASGTSRQEGAALTLGEAAQNRAHSSLSPRP